MMVYKEAIRKEVFKRTRDLKFSESYLNFNNISIIAHHGKITALILIRLCKHLGLDFFIINDFDFEENLICKMNFETIEDYKKSDFYINEIKEVEAFNVKGEKLSPKTKKSMMTTNWRLIN